MNSTKKQLLLLAYIASFVSTSIYASCMKKNKVYCEQTPHASDYNLKDNDSDTASLINETQKYNANNVNPLGQIYLCSLKPLKKAIRQDKKLQPYHLNDKTKPSRVTFFRNEQTDKQTAINDAIYQAFTALPTRNYIEMQNAREFKMHITLTEFNNVCGKTYLAHITNIHGYGSGTMKK
jgi:hypothetical protein